MTPYGWPKRWMAAAGALFLTGLLQGAALSTTPGSAQLEPHVSVSSGVSLPFPPAAPSDAGDDGHAESGEPVPSSAASSIELPEVDALMAKAIRSGRAPGAVVIVGRKRGVVFERAYGRRAIIPEPEEMTIDTIFDVASLTKPMVVAPLVAWLIEHGQVALGDAAVKYLPEFGARDKQNVTIEQLLLHTSGLPPTNSLRDFRQGPERARALTLGGWLYKYPGREFIYSDVGYIALGELIENVAGERLDAIAERELWKPLGMLDTHYCPTRCDDPRIAPTELNHGWLENPIRGEPSDTRAYRLGGVAGNAGVFSTAGDLARYARMLLGEGELDGVRVLAAERVRDMLRPRRVPKAVRALGWDIASGFSSGRGRELSERAVGHGGYTGTSLWIDPMLDLFVIFLSNRNHPYSTGKVTDVQGQVADLAVRALYPEGYRLGRSALLPRGVGEPLTARDASPAAEPRSRSDADATTPDAAPTGS